MVLTSAEKDFTFTTNLKSTLMKKFFSYLGIILLLAVIVAAFTSTGKEQCTKYVKEKISAEPAINLTVNEAPFKFLGAKIFAISIRYLILNSAPLICHKMAVLPTLLQWRQLMPTAASSKKLILGCTILFGNGKYC